MRKKNKISVVIIAYNSEKTIYKCLFSLSKQNFPKEDYEIVLVNDHSTDKTYKIAKQFKNVRIINQIENIHGISNARNTGIKNAEAPIIAFTDSDCIVPRNWLSKLYNFLKNNPDFVAVGGSLKAIKTSGVLSNVDGSIGEAYGNISGLATPNTAYLKSALLKEQLFDTQLITGEDPDLNWRLEKKGYKLKYLENIYVKHLWRSSLKSFIQHQFNYGRGRAQLIKKHPKKYSVLERNFGVSFLILLITLMIIALKSIFISFLFAILFLILFSLVRRLNLLKKIYKKNNLKILLISIFYFFITDIFNTFGILYQKSLKEK